MTEIVTFAEAQSQLRVDGTDDQTYIQALIDAASQAVIEYIDREAGPWVIETDKYGYPVLDSNDEETVIYDSNGDPEAAKPQVKAAVLKLVGILYRDRDTLELGSYKPTGLPASVAFLVAPLRRPVSE